MVTGKVSREMWGKGKSRKIKREGQEEAKPGQVGAWEGKGFRLGGGIGPSWKSQVFLEPLLQH